MLPRAVVLHAADRRNSLPGHRPEGSSPARPPTHTGGQLLKYADASRTQEQTDSGLSPARCSLIGLLESCLCAQRARERAFDTTESPAPLDWPQVAHWPSEEPGRFGLPI